MNKSTLFLLVLTFFTGQIVTAQTASVSGTVSDKGTGETLIGATVMYAPGKGAATDIDGKYSFELPYGEYVFTVSFVGFEAITETIVIDNKVVLRDFGLSPRRLREIEVIADLAVEKETPVAYSNIKPKQISNEIGTSDLPMLLNTTPGVYVSPTGGEDGGARVAIRGFQGRNITVMIDGIPINNMDRGNVFWSSTFGIDAVLANMQVQRGMTSSRLAIPAIGGTINYITKSIGNEPSIQVRQDFGSFNTHRTSLSYNSGRLKNGWGVSAAGSFRISDGYSDEQYKKEFFYYLKVQKEIGKHMISFTGMGSPVKYGLRRDQQKIVVYDKDYATRQFKGSDELYGQLAAYNVANNLNDTELQQQIADANGWGEDHENTYNQISSENDFIDTTGVISKGTRYNNHWGYLNGGIQNERERDYHKPIFSLRDFWAISDRLYWSNVVYYSFGNGGSTARMPSLGFGDYDENLQVDFDKDYQTNTGGGRFPAIDPLYSSTENKSTTILNKSFDNHYWVGWLSTVDYEVNENFKFAGGLDFRYYQSEQYRAVDNLLGGDYYVPPNDEFEEGSPITGESVVKREGDKYFYYNDNLMRWGAFFAEMKYSKDAWRAFINVSGVISGYKRRDYFANYDFNADDTRFPNAIGYGDVLFYNGTDVLVAAGNNQGQTASFFQSGDTTFVTNPNDNENGYAPFGDSYIVDARRVEFEDEEVSVSETPWKNIPGFSIKGGAGYSIDEFNSVFVNLGYISRTPRFRNVVELGTYNQFIRDAENENITSIELGYGYQKNRFAANINGYYTIWKNRPAESTFGVFLPSRGIFVQSNVNNLNARHAGVEFNATYLINKKLTIEAFAAMGDWIWTSTDDVNFFDDQGNPIYVENSTNGQRDSLMTISFDSEGVYVGDAPQNQFGLSLEYKVIKNGYIKARYTYFGKYYTSFDPIGLRVTQNGDFRGQQSWKLPDYGLVSFFAGYRFDWNNVKLDLNFVVDNLFDVMYIADGQNNAGGSLVTTDYLSSPQVATNSFDANSTSVYIGLPRTFAISAKFTL